MDRVGDEYVVGLGEFCLYLSLSPLADNVIQALDQRLFPISLSARTATIYDSGNGPISACTLGFIGQAVVAILQREQETANKYLNVVQFTITMNQLLKQFATELGVKEDDFAVTRVKSVDLEKDGQEKLAKEDYMGGINILMAWSFGEGEYNATVKEEDVANELLGLPRGAEKGVEEWAKEYVKSRGRYLERRI